MIRIDGREYKTITDAAQYFRVSPKSVSSWIEKGIVDEPMQVEHGIRKVYVCDDGWIRRAEEQRKKYLLRKKKGKRTRN
jgi:hypothetical protein